MKTDAFRLVKSATYISATYKRDSNLVSVSAIEDGNTYVNKII